MRRVFARFRQRTVGGIPAPDLALAGVFVAVAVASVLTGNPAEGPLALTLPVALVSASAVAWRRRSPLIMIVMIAVSGMIQTVLSQSPGSLWSLAVYAVAMYSVSAYSSELVAAVAGTAFVGVLLIEERLDSGVDYVFILLLFGGIWLLGRASQTWRGRVSQAERQQRDAARLATAEERLRIARELHDVVAHSLGAIAVQADAAEAALRLAPDRAVAPVHAIKETARDALSDIRRVLDVLRSDDVAGLDDRRTTETVYRRAVAAGSAGGQPPPARPPDRDTTPEHAGPTDIPGMVDTARASGMIVSLQLDLGPDAIPPRVGATGYRIVQEALTNARKHAPGSLTQVVLRQDPDRITVRVTNARPPTPAPASVAGGYGLQGMRERVRALDGTLHTGPTDDGGFAIEALLPLHAGDPSETRSPHDRDGESR